MVVTKTSWKDRVVVDHHIEEADPQHFLTAAMAAIETVVYQHQVTHNNKLTQSNKLQIASDTEQNSEISRNSLSRFAHALSWRSYMHDLSNVQAWCLTQASRIQTPNFPWTDVMQREAWFGCLDQRNTHWHTHAHTYNQVFAWWTECRNIHVSVSLRLKAPSPLGVLHL